MGAYCHSAHEGALTFVSEPKLVLKIIAHFGLLRLSCELLIFNYFYFLFVLSISVLMMCEYSAVWDLAAIKQQLKLRKGFLVGISCVGLIFFKIICNGKTGFCCIIFWKLINIFLIQNSLSQRKNKILIINFYQW